MRGHGSIGTAMAGSQLGGTARVSPSPLITLCSDSRLDAHLAQASERPGRAGVGQTGGRTFERATLSAAEAGGSDDSWQRPGAKDRSQVSGATDGQDVRGLHFEAGCRGYWPHG